VNYSVLALTNNGGNIVSVPQTYGTTHTLFAHVLPGLEINVRFAEKDHPAAIERLIDESTTAVFCESVSNPAGNICDLEAHRNDVPLLVDNTVATPLLLRPIDYGADIAAAYIARSRSVYQRTMGAVLSPLSAFLLLQGIETIGVRIDCHVEDARRVAEFLRDDPRVAWIKYLGGRACSLMTFGIRGGCEAGAVFYDALGLIKRLVNLGDAKSLACHPASTTHRQMSADQQRSAGVTPEMIRLSIGIEHVDDIIADLDQALNVAADWQRSSSTGGA
jgi:O-acetylhomoserine (thiol)-lyase